MSEYNRHKVALDVQDAVNLRALAREFVKVVDQAAEETQSTEVTWRKMQSRRSEGSLMNLRELRNSLAEIGRGHDQKQVAIIVDGKVYYTDATIRSARRSHPDRCI